MTAIYNEISKFRGKMTKEQKREKSVFVLKKDKPNLLLG